MSKPAYYIINGITIYRIIASFVLLVALVLNKLNIFTWLLAISFFTDLIDGYLSRRYKVSSIWGARLDSIGDDLTVLMAVVGMFMYKFDFIKEQKVMFILLLALFVVQNIYAFKRYGKFTSFHTWFAKLSALLQGLFFIHIFWMPKPDYNLFYFAAIVTAIDLVEEIALVYLLKEWKANVKGLYWVLRAHFLIFCLNLMTFP